MKTRVYAVAFAAEPHRGSEPGVGYEFARALARLSLDKRNEFTLYTRPHRFDQLTKTLATDVPGNRLRIIPISVWWPVARLLRKSRIRWGYMLWQIKATNAITRELSKVPTEDRVVVHHITFATVAVPTFEWRIRRPLGSIRRVLGPAGSSSMLLSDKPSLRERFDNVLRMKIASWNLKHTDLAVSQTLDLDPTFRRLGAKQVVVAPNAVVDLPRAIREVPSDPKRIVNVGLMIPRKRQSLALTAFSLLNDKDLHLVFVGDGPDSTRLRAQVEDMELSDRVHFTGRLTREEALTEIAKSAVLLHTAASEGATWVIAEAQALGTVPVAAPGTGADSTITIGGIGVIPKSDAPSDLALAVEEALTRPNTATDMWSRDRLPTLLSDWYQFPSEGQRPQ